MSINLCNGMSTVIFGMSIENILSMSIRIVGMSISIYTQYEYQYGYPDTHTGLKLI